MDQTRDISGREFYRLAGLYPAPPFVKAATVADLCGDAGLPPEAYGDPVHRLFPCHTRAATWASMAFFTDKRAAFKAGDAEMIEGRIARMARVHGVEGAVAAVKAAAAAHAATPEDALPDADFALVWRDADGRTQRRYPVRNGAEAKAAAHYLRAHRDAFPFEARREFADRLLDKAAAVGAVFDADTEAFLTKQAGHGACAAADAVDLIFDRVQASRRGPGRLSELQVEMLKFAQIIGRSPARFRAPGVRCKVAAVVDAFDRETGLREYGPGLPRVEDVLFALTHEKMAAVVAEHCETATGTVYRLEDLERVKLAELEDYFGAAFAQQLTSDGIRVDGEKAARFVPTLPRPDARDLERFLDDKGLRPVAKQAAAVGFSPEHFKAMADWRKTAMAGF